MLSSTAMQPTDFSVFSTSIFSIFLSAKLISIFCQQKWFQFFCLQNWFSPIFCLQNWCYVCYEWVPMWQRRIIFRRTNWDIDIEHVDEKICQNQCQSRGDFQTDWRMMRTETEQTNVEKDQLEEAELVGGASLVGLEFGHIWRGFWEGMLQVSRPSDRLLHYEGRRNRRMRGRISLNEWRPPI